MPQVIAGLDISDELRRVEALLLETASSDQPMVEEASVHLIRAGGKRFRPMLTLLCGQLGDAKDPRLVPCAAAIELTHLATLYHDDVIEEASVRRGAPTANARFGNSVAVLTGDFLLARSSALAAELGAYVSRRLAETIAALCEGQIMETGALGRLDVTAEHYLDVIRRKTAALISTACHLGAWLAGAHDEVVAAATEYGESAGMAFQLADDVLDIVGEQASTGKVPGTDLRAGVLTLPVLATLDGRVSGGTEIRASLDAKDVDASLRILRENGSIELARTEVARWQERARAALAPLPEGRARDALTSVANFVGQRTA